MDIFWLTMMIIIDDDDEDEVRIRVDVFELQTFGR